MKDESMKLALEAAYLAGFNASDEGYNGEYGIDCPEENAIWKKDRDNALRKALAEQPPQRTRQGLTDAHVEMIAAWLETQMIETPTTGPHLANALRYVGAKLKEKNT